VPGTAVVTLRRSGNLGQASTVSYAITAGTAQDGLDYQAAGATPASPVTFGIGQSTLLVRVPILPDPEDEPVQTFTLSLSAPVSAALASPTSATVNIGDNDVAGKISLAGTQWSVAEGAGTAIITLTRSGGAAGGASVVCQTGVGTATAGSDYTATAETVTFGPGQKTATCTIPILPNGTPENGESVPVTLGSPSFGVVLGTSSGTLFIADDD
jgi:hypothetical protein